MLFMSLIVVTLASCDSASNSLSNGQGGGVSPWGLPFRTGTQIQIGSGDGICEAGALHDDNFHHLSPALR